MLIYTIGDVVLLGFLSLLLLLGLLGVVLHGFDKLCRALCRRFGRR